MKNKIVKSNIVLITFCVLFVSLYNTSVQAQKKQRARVKAQYTKVGNNNFIIVSGKYKEHKKYKPAIGLDVNVYQVFENDSLDLLGKVVLNKNGKGKVNVDKAFKNNFDNYNFKVIHKDSKLFKKSAKSVIIKVAHLKAALNFVNQKPFITATLTNAKNKPIEGVELKVELQRLFAPLTIGKGPYFTNEYGTINIPITRKMPGINGRLNYDVVLEDSDDYGTIKSFVRAKIGSVVKDLSTFDQRTMWAPPSKAPLFDLIIPNILIFGIWGFLVALVFNLYRISKYKNA